MADAKNVAKKSSSIDERIMGVPKTNLKPSRMAPKLNSARCSDGRCGTSRMNSKARKRATNEIASKT